MVHSPLMVHSLATHGLLPAHGLLTHCSWFTHKLLARCSLFGTCPPRQLVVGTGGEQALLLTIYALLTAYSALPAYNVSPLTFLLLLTHTFATHSLLTLSSLHIPGQLYIPCVLPACLSTRVLLLTCYLLTTHSLGHPDQLKHSSCPLFTCYSSLAQQPHPR